MALFEDSPPTNPSDQLNRIELNPTSKHSKKRGEDYLAYIL